MSIVDENSLWITANFKETQIENMKVGQDVNIIVDAYPKQKFKGKIESVQAATGSKFSLLPADNATGNFVKVVQRSLDSSLCLMIKKIIFTYAQA